MEVLVDDVPLAEALAEVTAELGPDGHRSEPREAIGILLESGLDQTWVNAYIRRWRVGRTGTSEQAAADLIDLLTDLDERCESDLTLTEAVAWLAVPTPAGLSNPNVLFRLIDAWNRQTRLGWLYQAAGVHLNDYLRAKPVLRIVAMRAKDRGVPVPEHLLA